MSQLKWVGGWSFILLGVGPDLFKVDCDKIASKLIVLPILPVGSLKFHKDISRGKS